MMTGGGAGDDLELGECVECSMLSRQQTGMPNANCYCFNLFRTVTESEIEDDNNHNVRV